MSTQAHVPKPFQRPRGVASPTDLLRAVLALEDFSTRAWGAWAVLIGLADIAVKFYT